MLLVNTIAIELKRQYRIAGMFGKFSKPSVIPQTKFY